MIAGIAAQGGTGLQWGHRFSSVESFSGDKEHPQRAERFNGATDFHRWKGAPPRCAETTGDHGFNGATDFHRWKDAYLTGADLTDALQWGHRFSSVERMRSSIIGHLRRSLQWGHRFSSVERDLRYVSAVLTMGFNGATDFHRWKAQPPGLRLSFL